MKLLSYTYRKLALLLFLLMAVWGVLFYYAIIDEVVDETDDTLENYGEILMESALHDPSILETEGSLMSFYKFTPISEEEGRHYRQVFYDATVYIELEDEDEPVRVMCTAFRMPDGQYYELKLMISILERDDMVEAMLWYLGALFLLFLICTSIGIQLVLKGVFRPLHRLLDWLHCIQPGKSSSNISSTETSSISVYCPFSIRESNSRDLFSFTARPSVAYISSSCSICCSVIPSLSASSSTFPLTMASGVCNSCEAFSMNCFCSSYAL